MLQRCALRERRSNVRDQITSGHKGRNVRDCWLNTCRTCNSNLEIKGAFHSTKTFENLKTAANGPEFSGKFSRNSGNRWISEIRTIQPKIQEIPRQKLNGRKTWSVKKFSKICVYLARLSSFWEIFGKCCSIYYLKLPKIQTGLFGWIEYALGLRAPSVIYKTPATIFHNQYQTPQRWTFPINSFECTLFLKKNIKI